MNTRRLQTCTAHNTRMRLQPSTVHNTSRRLQTCTFHNNSLFLLLSKYIIVSKEIKYTKRYKQILMITINFNFLNIFILVKNSHTIKDNCFNKINKQSAGASVAAD